MKKLQVSILSIGLFVSQSVLAQNFSQKAVPLSKQASNGYFREVSVGADGSVKATFDFTEKKVSKTEVYDFDASLNLSKQSFAEPKTESNTGESKPDKTYSVMWANVGGNNSFDVLSLKLKVFKITYKSVWSKSKQRYIRNVENRESIKLKNLDDKSYLGYMAYANSNSGELFALSAIEEKKSKKFVLLNIKTDLSIQEIDVPLSGKYTLVYSYAAQNDANSNDDFDISDGEMVFIFAPADKSPDLKKYVYLKYNNQGKLMEEITFQSPSSNLAFTSSRKIGSDVYLFGSYTKSKDAFEEVFGEYGNIMSPGYAATEKLYGAENLRMFKYYKNLENADPLGMAVMKISGGKMVYLKDFPISSLEKVAKKAPTQKKVLVYDGRPLDINQFNVLDNGDFLVSGQSVGRISIALGEGAKSYKKLYCFHFDKNGDLRAQYGLEPESIDDKFNTLFPIQQQFILSADGKSIYWLILENISAEGYESFSDAYNGNKTWYARYFPSMIVINAASAELTSYEMLGNRMYYLNKNFPYIYSNDTKTITFVGRDQKNKNIWVGKYMVK